MKLREIVEKLDFKVVNESDNMDVDIRRGYASDMLSDVIANVGADDVWITIQAHQNIVAVAVLKGVAAIIIANKRNINQETIAKAKSENVALMLSDLPVFEIAGRLYDMGIRGITEQ